MAFTREEMRRLIGRHKIKDMGFEVLGLLVMLVSLLVLFALFGQLVIDGATRINPDFFDSFPSRRAGSAGILSPWPPCRWVWQPVCTWRNTRARASWPI